MVKTQSGRQPFAHITPSDARKVLRVMLGLVGIQECARYRTHDLRRRHAKDLQISGMHSVQCCIWQCCCDCSSGSPLHVILEAGQWASPAFLKYIDVNRLDEELVLQAHCDESSGSD